MRKNMFLGTILVSSIIFISTAHAETAATNSWNGAYGGVSLGYSFGSGQKTTTTGTPTFLTLTPTIAPTSLTNNGKGFIGGVDLGYNYRDGSLVYGAEADISYVDQKRSNSFSGAPIPGLAPAGITTSASQKLNYLATLRARLGFVAADNFLVYGTGGLAFGGIKTVTSVVANGAPAVAWNGATSKTKAGWTLGAGGEYLLGQNISLKGEYLYYSLGSVNTSALGNTTVRSVAALNGIDYITNTKTRGSALRVGINYHF